MEKEENIIAPYLQYSTADVLARFFPRKWCYSLSHVVSDYLFNKDVRGRNAVVCNLRRIHQFLGLSVPEDKLFALARETFRNFGKYLTDFFWFAGRRTSYLNDLVHVPDRSGLDSVVGMHRGIIGVSAHLGNWETGPIVIAREGLKVNAVVLPMNDRKTNDLFQSRRKSRGINVIPLGFAARESVIALRKGEMVALLGDRDYTRHVAEFEFMGLPARFPTGPAKLCRLSGSPILPGFLVMKDDGKFEMLLYEPIIPERSTHWQEIQARLLRIMEDVISKHPTQWFIFDPFWQTS